MAQEVAFDGPNYGSQTGINYGSITNEFQLLSDPSDRLPVVYGAMFDSSADQHEQECLPGTRIDLLDQIKEWAFSPESRCIYWLNGMAGTGKSTISRTVASFCSKNETLGASFFFKRGESDRGNSMKLFSTIARQLATNCRWLKPAIQQAVQDDPSIAMKGMREQFLKLILQPLLNSKRTSHPLSHASTQIVMIVIDALDECDSEKDIRLVLQLLPQLQKLTLVQVRVFLTSRPELPIRLGFEQLASHHYEHFILHEISEDVIEHDIALYLDHRLSVIRDERKTILPTDWPGLTNFRKLVFLSVPLFIFTATICRILEDPYWDPLESLAEILAHRNHGSKLDGTYLPVLSRLLHGQDEERKERLVHEFRQIVGAIITLKSPLSVTSLSSLIGLPERLVYLRLESLHSVLAIPNDKSVPIRPFHLSFRDYLLHSETRKKSPFWVDEKAMHHVLTKHCFHTCQQLRRNICRLASEGSSRANFDRQTIQQYLPTELQYACRYWSQHMAQCIDLDHVIENGLVFLQRHFLHWVEAMSLMGLASELAGLLDLLQTFIPNDDHSRMREFLYDGTRFLLKNRQIIEDAPLQVYSAGLLFVPKATSIRSCFANEFPAWLRRLPKVKENWSTELQTLEGHTRSINSVIFSSDGQLLASASSDHTVRIWDSSTGALQHILEAHKGPVTSAVFSPNGQLLVSGSDDKRVHIWDTATGSLLQTLKGHASLVSSVAFSLDGGLLASGSWDKTVRIYEAASGCLLRVIRGHTAVIHSVAFSPNGHMLASGSSDRIIRIWDPMTGALSQALEGHKGSVHSVAFSPSGQLLASGSLDTTVRLWSIATGAMELCIEDHTNPVHSVTFSSDGLFLASGSLDRILCHWGTKVGLQIFEGHTKSVTSVALSPNHQLLASGSWDRAVKLWDNSVCDVQKRPEERPSAVDWMEISPNSQRLVSGSFPSIMRLWDTASEDLLLTIESDIPTEWVSFSLDSRYIACGSDSEAIRLWDTKTGSCVWSSFQDYIGFNHIAFSHDNRLIACISLRDTIQLWDTGTGALHQTLKGHLHFVSSFSFCPNSQLLASGSLDETVRLWNTTTGTVMRTLEGHLDSISSVEFSPDGRLLASGSQDGIVRLWNVSTGTVLRIFDDYETAFSLNQVTFSPDGRHLVSRCDGKVQRWDNATGFLQYEFESAEMPSGCFQFSDDDQLLASSSLDELKLLGTVADNILESLRADLSNGQRPEIVVLSPDRQLLATTYGDKPIQLWDFWTGLLHHTLDDYSGSTSIVAFSPNSCLLASSSNRTVQLWDTATGALMKTLNAHTSSVHQVVFSHDSSLLVYLSIDSTIRLWDTATGALQHIWLWVTALAKPVLPRDSSCLESNLSPRDITSRNQTHSRNPLKVEVIEQGQWITRKGENILWLPPEFRATCFAIDHSLLTLGHESGRVSFMEFHV